MSFPDLHGYELDSQLYSAARLVVLWFSKIERELGLWRQIQVTLVGARLNAANFELERGFPALRSCEISERPTPKGNRKVFLITFVKGQISFECEDIAYAEFSRKIRSLPDSNQ